MYVCVCICFVCMYVCVGGGGGCVHMCVHSIRREEWKEIGTYRYLFSMCITHSHNSQDVSNNTDRPAVYAFPIWPSPQHFWCNIARGATRSAQLVNILIWHLGEPEVTDHDFRVICRAEGRREEEGERFTSEEFVH